MGPQPPTYERHVDRDGVTRIQKPRTGSGTWIVGLALGFTVLCVIASLWLLSPSEPTSQPTESAPARTVERTPTAPPRPSRPRAPASPAPTASQAVASEGAAAEPVPEETAVPAEAAEGIHLYRPGTLPLKQGLVVPEDFKLPDGYMRHYQTTDSGEEVKPILMFRDDFTPKDASGNPVEIPANRVVPMELAPAGMPIEVLELPEGPEGVEPLP